MAGKMIHKQQLTQKGGFKIVKIRPNTYNLLIKEIRKQEVKNPYLKHILSFDSIIKMLLYKRKIKLSKYKYILKRLKGGLKK